MSAERGLSMKLRLFAALGGLTLVMAGCDPTVESILKGNHSLRKLVERSETQSHASGGFFFVVGSYEANTKTQMLVKFAWQMNDGVYAISSLPLEKIRVRLDNTVKTPTIEFHSDYGDVSTSSDLQVIIDRFVNYAVITCREADWPVKIQMPLNQ